MADISVIIPCYNVGPYIDRCIASVLFQTIGVDALKIVCVDDASTDDTWDHLQIWEQQYPDTICAVHCDVNGRQGRARNIGLQYSSGEWIAFIDADDWVEPDYIEKMYRIAGQVDCEIICCRHERDFSEELSFLQERKTGREDHFMDINTAEKRKLFIYHQSAGGAWAKLIRRDVLVQNEIYFPENLAYEDNYWTSMIHCCVSRVYFVEEKLYHYFVNRDSTVLLKDQSYHIDLLTVQLLKWREWERRGFLKEFREELEYESLFTYLVFLKILFLRYTEPPYSFYLLAKEIILDQVKDYNSNKYVREGCPEVCRILLQSLRLPLDRNEFLQLAEYAGSYWGLPESGGERTDGENQCNYTHL